jgi:hypothetical protein
VPAGGVRPTVVGSDQARSFGLDESGASLPPPNRTGSPADKALASRKTTAPAPSASSSYGSKAGVGCSASQGTDFDDYPKM